MSLYEHLLTVIVFTLRSCMGSPYLAWGWDPASRCRESMAQRDHRALRQVVSSTQIRGMRSAVDDLVTLHRSAEQDAAISRYGPKQRSGLK